MREAISSSLSLPIKKTQNQLVKSQSSNDSFDLYLRTPELSMAGKAEMIQRDVQLLYVFISTQSDRSLSTENIASSILKYKEHLDQLVISHPDVRRQRNRVLLSLSFYIRYLFDIKKVDVRPDYSLLQLKEPIFDDLGCTHYRKYISSFFVRNYTNVDDKIFAVKHFLRRIPLAPSKLNELTMLHVKEYEKVFFLERVSREEIVKQTARVHLDQVRHFLIFLRNHGVINFAYSVPLELFGTESRDNEFVNPEYLMKFYTTLFEIKTPDSEKYLCIFLLLLETGCRPIEICNLTYADFRETEGTLAFTCMKSDRRVLKIDPYVKEALVQYIQKHRKCLLPNEHIFLKQDGSLLLTKNITSMFKSYNYLAFDRIVFSAKTLRHTFITNALDEKNDFDIVSKSVGHKDWRSTMHYFHRSVKRLLKNTLPYNPNVRSE